MAPSYTYKNFEQNPMNRSFSMRPCQSDLVWRWNFWDFDMNIFEKWWFYTYMDNMHIKWKLKSFWIHIWCQKVLLCMKFFEKIGFQKNFFFNFRRKKKFDFKFFFFNFLKKKKFWSQIFQNFILTTHKFFFLEWF